MTRLEAEILERSIREALGYLGTPLADMAGHVWRRVPATTTSPRGQVVTYEALEIIPQHEERLQALARYLPAAATEFRQTVPAAVAGENERRRLAAATKPGLR